MKDEKQQPTAEQVEQWKIETLKVSYIFGANPLVTGYLAGRQKSFEEVARLQAENEVLNGTITGINERVGIEVKDIDGYITNLKAELERVTKERDELRKTHEIRESNTGDEY